MRKQAIERVFGIIKNVMGFRPFFLRGLNEIMGEQTLVWLAPNFNRMAVLLPQ